MTHHFVVPGEAVAKGRPRASIAPNGRFARMYTPQKSARFEQLVSLHAREQIGLQTIVGPLAVTIEAFFEWPLGKRRQRIPRGQEPMTEKPDVDNLAKSVLDGLAAWFRDQQVAELIVRKWRAQQGEPARTEITITQIERGGQHYVGRERSAVLAERPAAV